MKYTKEEYEKAKEWWNNLSDADEQKYFSQLKEFFNSYRELIVAAYYRFGQ